MDVLITVVHIVTCIFLIIVVLLQSGKGGVGMALGGGGGSQSVFGGRGAGDFLTRLTGITAAIFMITSMGLSLMAAYHPGDLEGKAEQFNAAPLPQNDPGAVQPTTAPTDPGEGLIEEDLPPVEIEPTTEEAATEPSTGATSVPTEAPTTPDPEPDPSEAPAPQDTPSTNEAP